MAPYLVMVTPHLWELQIMESIGTPTLIIFLQTLLMATLIPNIQLVLDSQNPEMSSQSMIRGQVPIKFYQLMDLVILHG